MASNFTPSAAMVDCDADAGVGTANLTLPMQTSTSSDVCFSSFDDSTLPMVGLINSTIDDSTLPMRTSTSSNVCFSSFDVIALHMEGQTNSRSASYRDERIHRNVSSRAFKNGAQHQNKFGQRSEGNAEAQENKRKRRKHFEFVWKVQLRRAVQNRLLIWMRTKSENSLNILQWCLTSVYTLTHVRIYMPVNDIIYHCTMFTSCYPLVFVICICSTVIIRSYHDSIAVIHTTLIHLCTLSFILMWTICAKSSL